jgi:hypothetical protein
MRGDARRKSECACGGTRNGLAGDEGCSEEDGEGVSGIQYDNAGTVGVHDAIGLNNVEVLYGSMSSQLLVVLLPYYSEVRPSPLGHLSYIPEMLKTVPLGTSALGHHSTPHCVQRRSEYLRSHHGIGQNGAREIRRQQTLVLWVTEMRLESRGSEVSHSWRHSYIVTCQLVRS